MSLVKLTQQMNNKLTIVNLPKAVLYFSFERLIGLVYYFNNEKTECDFLVKENMKIKKAIQVCYFLDGKNKKREINGLVDAMKKFKLKKGLILTYNQEDEFEVGNKKIIVKPVWKWLIE